MRDARKIAGSNACPGSAMENHAAPPRNVFRSCTCSGRLLAGLVGGAALISSGGCSIPLSNSQAESPTSSESSPPSVSQNASSEEGQEKGIDVSNCVIGIIGGAAVGLTMGYILTGGDQYIPGQYGNSKITTTRDQVVALAMPTVLMGLIFASQTCREHPSDPSRWSPSP